VSRLLVEGFFLPPGRGLLAASLVSRLLGLASSQCNLTNNLTRPDKLEKIACSVLATWVWASSCVSCVAPLG
jgi:hypothetical protein